jgi:hypothetical protein
VRDKVEFTRTNAEMVTISSGSTSPIVAMKEWVPFATVPVNVTEITSINVGKESTMMLSTVVKSLVFPTLMVKVSVSFTLADEGETETEIVAPGFTVAVLVGVAVGGVPVIVGVVDGVTVTVGLLVGVDVLVGVFPGEEVSIGVGVSVAVAVLVETMVGIGVSVTVGVAVTVSVSCCE